jgi:hypothetical protein
VQVIRRIMPALFLLAFLLGAAPAGSGSPAETPGRDDETADETPGGEGEGDEASIDVGAPTSRGAGPGRQLLRAEAQRELQAMRAAHYVHHTHVDEAAGLFDYDCSGFVDYALRHSVPDALETLRQATVHRPLAKHFVAFVSTLPPGARAGLWRRVARIADLRPGDIIAWLRPPDSHSHNTGHVMLVGAPPRPRHGFPGEFEVVIVDSTHSPHGKTDLRRLAGTTGLGSSAVVLVGDAGGAPVAYRWSVWKRSPLHTTPVVLASLD